MERLARFIVKYRIYFAALFVALTVAGIICTGMVKQNYDLTKYLPANTDTSQGLKIMQDEFGSTNVLIVAVEVADDGIADMQSKLSSVEGVQLAALESYNNGQALYILSLSDGGFSDGAKATLGRVKSELGGYNYAISGATESDVTLENALNKEIPIIMVIAIVIIAIVLFLTSHSWTEPLVFAIVMLGAVLINMGSNIIFGEISYITFAVSAILQLALSLDYSIILLHGYNKFKNDGLDSEESLVKSLARNMRSISSSGLTTIAGLVALFFMSFTIGFDIGIVLAKGILVSLLCVIFFMPSLIMLFSKLLAKGKHKLLPLGQKYIAKASLSHKNIMPILFVAVIAVAFMLQANNKFAFDGWDNSPGIKKINESFGNVNQAVLIVDDGYADDEDALNSFVNSIKDITDEDGEQIVDRVTSWANLELTASDIVGGVSFDTEQISGQLSSVLGNFTVSDLAHLWDECGGDIFNIRIPLSFVANMLGVDQTDRSVSIIYDLLKEDGVVTVGSALNKYEALSQNALIGDLVSDKVPDEAKQIIATIMQNRAELSAAARAAITPIIEDVVAHNDGAASIFDIDSPLGNFGGIDGMLTGGTVKVFEFYKMWQEAGSNLADVVISESMIADLTGMPIPEVLITMIMSVVSNDGEVTVGELIEFLHNNKDSIIIKDLFGEQMLGIASLMYFTQDLYLPFVNDLVSSVFDMLRSQFVGCEHNRIVLIMDLPDDLDASFAVLDAVKNSANKYFGDNNYLAGESMTVKDVADTFEMDIKKINWITIISIFAIIAILFRSILLPAILVLVIQGAIWITMAIQALMGTSIFFMSYIICICILMGATIDYGLLIASSYRRNRQTMSSFDAVTDAVKTAIPTVLTSGTILVVAGVVVGFVSSVLPIYSIGRLLGLGTVCSIILITFLLPSVLLIFDKVINKTTWDGVKPYKKADEAAEEGDLPQSEQ